MTTERPGSPLPEDPQYWERLANRIRDDAAGPLAAYRAAAGNDPAATPVATGLPTSWQQVLASHATWWIAASLAAALLLWAALPPRPPSAAFRWMERRLAPAEAAGTLIAASSPPPVEMVMAQFPPEAGGAR